MPPADPNHYDQVNICTWTANIQHSTTPVLIPRNCDGHFQLFPLSDDHITELNGYENEARVLVLGQERVSEVTPITPGLLV